MIKYKVKTKWKPSRLDQRILSSMVLWILLEIGFLNITAYSVFIRSSSFFLTDCLFVSYPCSFVFGSNHTNLVLISSNLLLLLCRICMIIFVKVQSKPYIQIFLIKVLSPSNSLIFLVIQC